jgi:hypothetical protein
LQHFRSTSTSRHVAGISKPTLSAKTLQQAGTGKLGIHDVADLQLTAAGLQVSSNCKSAATQHCSTLLLSEWLHL